MALLFIRLSRGFFGCLVGGYHKFVGLIEVTELPWVMLCLRKAEISAFLECIHGIVKSIFFMPCDLLFGVNRSTK